eukprot:CAMPEP_0202898534 /NCGR_PEP_ID=MMETSP1392-20130828/7034_1 /ASSEMBLY_ACC=CAM_ASM_000868 /TAXON_ID=225041 /ORGANISM="Chlamydomonas chlamydogama, Strain SAG 11-48b" /LENGTH=332 /DNA_ID=CAMNT_0049584491 /DNA_START=259 /DNA_END=1257 /DNA_ORIENTATION=+
MPSERVIEEACKTLVARDPKVSPLTQSALVHMFKAYADVTPSVAAVLRNVLLHHFPASPIYHDHYAFRTFGVPGLGISSLSEVLLPLGYTQRQDTFAFPNKKLLATWFGPRDPALYDTLPRIFMSEIEVHKLSEPAQQVIARYTSHLSGGVPGSTAGVMSPTHTLSALLTRSLPWDTPSLHDYELLLKESEYAAWVLAHGYALNHTALATHRLAGLPDESHGGTGSTGVRYFTELVKAAGMPINEDGGLVKVSPDGLLLQSSTCSDMVHYTFAGGQVRPIAGAYIEFVERRVLPQFTGQVPAGSHASEAQRRDGFEVASADKIFQSTNIRLG